MSRATPAASSPQLSRAGWRRSGSGTKQRVRKAVTDLAEELLELYAARERAARARVRDGHALAVGDGGGVPLRGDASTSCARPPRSRPTWSAPADGPAGRRRRRLRQDRGRAARRVQGHRRTASRSPCSCPRPCSRRSTSRPSAQRFAAYPVKVGVLSRFVLGRASRRRVLDGLRDGLRRPGHRDAPAAVEGHRFRDLGLVVVDEEQRFGVAHKETPQAAADRGRRADAVGDADPADAQSGARRRSAT